jgi:hypothetical protein
MAARVFTVRFAGEGRRVSRKRVAARMGALGLRSKRSNGREPQRRLIAEVELFDGPQERKLRCAKSAVHARGTPVRDFFGEQRLQQLLVAPLLLLGARDQAAPRTATVRQVKALEQRVEVRAHGSPRRRTRVSVS